MSNNTHGNRNESTLAKRLDNKMYKNLNKNLQNFILSIEPNVNPNTKIIATHRKDKSIKNNVNIEINNKTFEINVMLGKNNSVHQENIEDFIKDLNIPKNIADSFRKFVWGDGTLDGTGNIKQRLKHREIKKKYPKIIADIQSYLNDPNNKQKLLERFLKTGRGISSVDYIYYGTPKKGIWKSITNIISFHGQKKTKQPSIGNLTFQAWKRSFDGRCDKGRGQIQLKWNIHKDITKIK